MQTAKTKVSMHIYILAENTVKEEYLSMALLTSTHIRALEILKSESVQPMTMTSSMSTFPKKKKKKYVYITCHEN